MTRDRDQSGRPRNARPRDALGRPLPRAQAGADVGQLPGDLALAGPDAARLADQLLRAGRPFHAHEVLEAAWKSGPPRERDLWQGLAQIAVGLTHAHRGNARGAVTLLRRGALRVRAYRDQGEPPGEGEHRQPYGMDLDAVLAASDELAARIERQGLADIPAADLAPKLMTPAPEFPAPEFPGALVAGHGRNGRGGLRPRLGIRGHLSRGEREAGVGLPDGGGEHHAVHGALGRQQRAA